MRKRTTPRPALRLEWLEAREVPAVLLQIDYTYDTGFFKNNADARAVMERVATELGNSLNASLSAITPGGGNNWNATFYNPSTGAEVSIANPTIGANTLKIYVGARNIPGSEGGFGGAGGYVLSGSTAFNTNTQFRGHSGYAPWGGSITFDSTENWHFGQTTSGLTGSSKTDFYTVAMHEMAHVLGVGTSAQWNANVSGSTFVGSSARSVYGRPVPLSADRAHWADGVTLGGAATVLDPVLPRGTRVNWTSLDAAALRDIGWGTVVTSPPVTSPPVTSPPPATSPPVTSPPVTSPPVTSPPVVSPPTTSKPVSPPVVASAPTIAFGGGADGTLVVYTWNGSALTATGQRYTPFAGYRGELRLAGGDFNGDGITDYAVGTGSGTAGVVAVLNGKDGSFLVSPSVVASGSNGVYLAAGDIDNDGKADVIVAPGSGASPLVQVFGVSAGSLQQRASFTAFDAPGWRGGVRVASGDINGDGFDDVVVTSGSQVGAISVVSGAALRNGTATRLVSDFMPFGALPIGLNVAVGDMDGDGKAELAVGLEKGAPPFVAIWSGSSLTRGSTGGVAAAFLALPIDTAGVKLAVRDLNNDGKAELVVAGGTSVPVARAYTLPQAQSGGSGSGNLMPPLTGGTAGIYVG